METEEKELEGGLQPWQEEILNMSMEEFNLIDKDNILNREDWDIAYDYLRGVEIPLKKKQMKMLEWALSDEYFILRANDRKVLKRVYERGYYYEEDKEVLNWIRENILMGKNFIK